MGQAVDTSVQLNALRNLMSSHEGGPLSAYIVPSEDAHQSEYVAQCDLRREFISGFSGSAGLALVTSSQALLWTDGRYYLQATQQLSSEWKLMRAGEDPSAEEWLAKNLPPKSRAGIDPTCLSIDAAKEYKQALMPSDIELVFVDANLVDRIWAARPAPPQGQIFVHPLEFAGKSVEEKLKCLREELTEHGAGAIVIAALDEVAWLYNIRGNDVPYNPVVRSYALVTQENAFFYVDKSKCEEPEIKDYLAKIGVIVRDYDEILQDAEVMATCSASLIESNAADNDSKSPSGSTAASIWLDPSTCSAAIYECVQAKLAKDHILLQASPLALAKALKNPVELEGMRDAHIRDGAAMVAFLAWLDEQVQQQLGGAGYFLEERSGLKRKLRDEEEKLTEISVGTKLEHLRSQQKHYVELSFPTISSVGSNAAIIHYRPEPASCAELDPHQMYLCDSGAQYRDGTTDVTRTLHFGKPSAHQRLCFTQVLKGHIMLDTAVFPKGTTGHTLDVLARVPLWQQGLDYRHGTGHGVGSYLNVHEGPHLISFRPKARNAALQATMTVTNEPGYYEDGSFGVRVENVMLVKDAECAHNFGSKGYLAFETITWVPIQQKLIETSLLTDSERKWVDAYHQKCREKLTPVLSGAELAWLEAATKPLPA